MAIASGVAKVVAIKKEGASTWGVAAGQSGGKIIRRKTSDIDLSKDTYESEEMRSDYQVANFTHGVRSVRGNIDGELSPGSYQDFMAAALRRLFTTVAAVSSLTITVAGAGPTHTLTRSAGDFTSSALKIGMVIRATGLVNSASNNKNLFIVGMSTTVLTVYPLNGVALAGESNTASVALTPVGRATWVPATGHTDDSFTIEHWYSDITQSELFLGCKVANMEIQLPPTGNSTIRIGIMGKDLAINTADRGGVALTSQYFSTPAAAGTTGVAAAISGAVFAQGSRVALLTGMSLFIDGKMSAQPVVGSNTYPEINEGRVAITGQLSVLFENATFRDYFAQETEVSLVAAFASDPSSPTSDFIAITLPRVKAGGAAKSDGERGLVMTMPFRALVGSVANYEATSIMIQDSAAV